MTRSEIGPQTASGKSAVRIVRNNITDNVGIFIATLESGETYSESRKRICLAMAPNCALSLSGSLVG